MAERFTEPSTRQVTPGVAPSQPLAALALAALEPDTPSSCLANRVLPMLDSAARVIVMPQLQP